MDYQISPKTIAGLVKHIRMLMPHWQSDSLGGFEYLSGGYSNDNYCFNRSQSDGSEQFVLRMPKVKQPFVSREVESLFYQRLPEHVGVKPIALDVNSGVMITPMLKGEILAEVYLDNFSEQDLLDHVKKLHLEMPAIDREYNMLRLAELYEVDTASLPPPDSLQMYHSCHNDLNPWNIMVTEQGWRTLDWEFVGLNDPLFDLVALHQGLELPASGLLDLSIQLIGVADPARLLKVQKSFWYREWAWADFQIRAGNVREEIVAQHEFAMEHLAGF